jgi:tRNA-dihydrouridine synthase
VSRQHLTHSVAWKGEKLGIFEMRRHYTNYFRNLPDFKEFRMKLVSSELLEELMETLQDVEKRYSGYEAVTIR